MDQMLNSYKLSALHAQGIECFFSHHLHAPSNYNTFFPALQILTLQGDNICFDINNTVL